MEKSNLRRDLGPYIEKAFSDKTEPEEFGIAIGKNNAKLQEAINKALEQMDKDGFLKDTADYWFSSQE